MGVKIWQHSNLKQPNTHRKLVETRAIIVKFGGRKSSAVKEDSLSNLVLAAKQRAVASSCLDFTEKSKEKRKINHKKKKTVVCHFVNGHCLASIACLL